MKASYEIDKKYKKSDHIEHDTRHMKKTQAMFQNLFGKNISTMILKKSKITSLILNKICLIISLKRIALEQYVKRDNGLYNGNKRNMRGVVLILFSIHLTTIAETRQVSALNLHCIYHRPLCVIIKLIKMRHFILLTIYLTLFLSCVQPPAKVDIPVLNSNNKKLIAYLNNDTIKVNWAYLPKLDVYSNHIECVNQQNPILIISDIDTISFNIILNDTVRFYLLFNNKEKALVEMIGIPKNVHFSEEYIQEHKNKISIEIPEVHELANVLVAISKIGQKDGNMVDLNTSYHKEVLKHFLSYVNHPIMDSINANITDREMKSYWYYYALKMNACGYVFDDNGQIINQGIVRKLGFNENVDPLVKNAKLMENFARKSNFRAFYKDHKSYYDSLIVVYKQLNPISKMKNWLEKKFGIEYGNYTVFFSPLVGGAHSTNRFRDNGFEQTFMFVSRAGNLPGYNANINQMLASRVVFTEIDHNFVNPVSDKKIEAIKKAFFNRGKWTSDNVDKSAYNNDCSVFNEYMTWGLFSLYCLDFFPNEDAKQFIPMMENQMVFNRHFIKFKEFNQQLIKLYENDPNISVNDLFDKVLQWCMVE